MKVAKNVSALHPESFTDVIHRFLREYGDESCTDGVITYSKRSKDGKGSTIVRSFFGDHVMCVGLCDLVKDYIKDEM